MENFYPQFIGSLLSHKLPSNSGRCRNISFYKGFVRRKFALIESPSVEITGVVYATYLLIVDNDFDVGCKRKQETIFFTSLKSAYDLRKLSLGISSKASHSRSIDISQLTNHRGMT